jgi:uncharacterized protein (DUF849 family)
VQHQGASLIQAALNGTRTKTEHPTTPESIQELVWDAVASVSAGATAIHLHPRDADGRESLDGALVDEVARTVRAACGVPIGVTTGAWIEPDLDKRLALIRAWREPDYSSVNLSENGAVDVMRALLVAGVGIEAGIGSAADVDLLAGSGLGDRVVRILVEPYGDEIEGDPISVIDGIHRALDRHDIRAPRLQHSDGAFTWPVLIDALMRGCDTRIGLEDTIHNPDGAMTAGNAELVAAAIRLQAAR